jgi:hypothetical protein
MLECADCDQIQIPCNGKKVPVNRIGQWADRIAKVNGGSAGNLFIWLAVLIQQIVISQPLQQIHPSLHQVIRLISSSTAFSSMVYFNNINNFLIGEMQVSHT